jgi:putative glutamine amidotransferase
MNARPRIAIPMPHAGDREYAGRAILQYERAVELAGGEPVRIALDLTTGDIAKIIAGCDGVLLPGSKADVEPAKFKAPRSPQAAAADPGREAIDDLLLEDAFEKRKPVLGICYGLQSLNVYRGGSLIQHIPDFLPEDLRSRINHDAGKKVAVAHDVEICEGSKLENVLCRDSRPRLSGRAQPGSGDSEARDNAKPGNLVIPVNSSHHQSADAVGAGLRVVAHCTDDGIIEALEGIAADHFVLAVQWHPERSVDDDGSSRTIFRALIEAARARRGK